MNDSLLACALTLAAIIIVSVYQLPWNPKRLPPGPPRKLFGTRTTPVLPPYQLFALMHKKFGPIFSFYQGKTPVIVLGTVKIATDLLEKQGSIYSSRPRNIMAGEILSGGMRGLGMPYGTRWRNWRSLMHAGMSIEASQKYKKVQSVESTILLKDLLEEKDPELYSSHLRRFALSIVLCVAYGLRVQTIDDPVVIRNQQSEACYSKMSTPGKYFINSWPIFLKLPRFLQWFRYEAEAQRAKDTEMYMTLMNQVRRKMEMGIAQPSIARWGLEKQENVGLTDLEIAYALSAPFTAGVGTTLAAIDVFLLAMLHYPEVMKKAQAELDSVVGPARLPGFDDYEMLPYIQAVVRETLRWKPIVPVGVPHSSTAEGTYEDMHIPNGSTVFANIAFMSTDEEMFPSSGEFKPERYLNEEASNATQSIFYFGFGRRICPGLHVAQNSLFIVIARVLWAFNIMPSIDAEDRPILPPVDDFIGGLSIRPRPFPYLLAFRADDGVRTDIREQSSLAEKEALAWT